MGIFIMEKETLNRCNQCDFPNGSQKNCILKSTESENSQMDICQTVKQTCPLRPLPLETVRQLNGDKVFIQYIGSCKGFYADDYAPYYGDYEQYVQKDRGSLKACFLPLQGYGTEWLAYSSRPDEGSGR